MLDSGELSGFLKQRSRTVLDGRASIECAVLVAMYAGDRDVEVIYTLRAAHLPNHSGQVSFPGGKRADGDETLEATALREAEEEIGLAPESVTLIGAIDDVYTMATDFVITPYLGWLHERPSLVRSEDEVDEIFTVPLSSLADRQRHGKEEKSWKDSSFTVDVIDTGRHRIWGATHRMTVNLLEVLGAAGVTFEKS